jgi:hypothetical protein
MERTEAKKIALRSILGEFLANCSGELEPCWYRIFGDRDKYIPNTEKPSHIPALSGVFGVNDELSDELLLACGLIYYHSGKLRIKNKEWESLLIEFRLNDDVEVTSLTHTNLIGSRVHVIRIGSLGAQKSFRAGDQAASIQNGTLKIEPLTIYSQQNDFRNSITRHLMTTEVPKGLVKDAEGSVIDKDAQEVEDEEEDDEKVGEDREGTSAGTAVIAVTASSKPKHTVTIDIGEESYNTPIVYRAGNRKKQVLLKVPRSTTQSAFQRNLLRTNFLENLLQSLGPNVEESTKWLLDALANKSGKKVIDIDNASRKRKADGPCMAIGHRSNEKVTKDSAGSGNHAAEQM